VDPVNGLTDTGYARWQLEENLLGPGRVPSGDDFRARTRGLPGHVVAEMYEFYLQQPHRDRQERFRRKLDALRNLYLSARPTVELADVEMPSRWSELESEIELFERFSARGVTSASELAAKDALTTLRHAIAAS
jgi:hypothetical protein